MKFLQYIKLKGEFNPNPPLTPKPPLTPTPPLLHSGVALGITC